MAHKGMIRQERPNEYRVTCSCGWIEKAVSHSTALARLKRHQQFPHKTGRP